MGGGSNTPLTACNSSSGGRSSSRDTWPEMQGKILRDKIRLKRHKNFVMIRPFKISEFTCYRRPNFLWVFCSLTRRRHNSDFFSQSQSPLYFSTLTEKIEAFFGHFFFRCNKLHSWTTGRRQKKYKKGLLLFLFQTFVQSIFVLENSTEISLVMRLISLVVFWSSFWNSRVRLGSPSLGEDAWNREGISNSTFSLLMQFKLGGTLGS